MPCEPRVCSANAVVTVSASWPGISSAAYDTFNCGNMLVLIQPFRNLRKSAILGTQKKNLLPSLINLIIITRHYQLAKIKVICSRISFWCCPNNRYSSVLKEVE